MAGIGDLLQMGAKFPLSTGSLAVAAGETLAPVGKSLVSDPFNKEVKNVVAERRNYAVQAAKMERLRRTMAENTARLASLDPHTYNEVLAGRKLAPGTVVFGGRPRTDLMERLAMQMSTGRFEPPDQGDLMDQLM